MVPSCCRVVCAKKYSSPWLTAKKAVDRQSLAFLIATMEAYHHMSSHASISTSASATILILKEQRPNSKDTLDEVAGTT